MFRVIYGLSSVRMALLWLWWMGLEIGFQSLVCGFGFGRRRWCMAFESWSEFGVGFEVWMKGLFFMFFGWSFVFFFFIVVLLVGRDFFFFGRFGRGFTRFCLFLRHRGFVRPVRQHLMVSYNVAEAGTVQKYNILINRAEGDDFATCTKRRILISMCAIRCQLEC